MQPLNVEQPTKEIKKANPEIELGKRFEQCLIELGYEVYKEVDDIDIVAVHPETKETYAIELKTELNFKVIEQAHKNKIHCDYSYIGVPKQKRLGIKDRICRSMELGLFQLKETWNGYNDELCYVDEIDETVKAQKNIVKDYLRPKLYEFHKTNDAGTNSEIMTAWKYAVTKIVDVIKENKQIHYGDIHKHVKDEIGFSAQKIRQILYNHCGKLSILKNVEYGGGIAKYIELNKEE